MRDDAAPRPSDRAVERLAGGVEGDLQVLRGTLHRALDEAERFAAEGRGDLAAAVVDEQRSILLAFHRRLEERVAEAAVEREAELVVGATDRVVPTRPTAVPAAPVAAADGALRLVAAAVAAVVGVGLLASSAPPAGDMTAAGTASEERDGGGARPAVGEPLPSSDPLAPATSDAAGRAPRTGAGTAPAAPHDAPGPVAPSDASPASEDEPPTSPDGPGAGPAGLQVVPPAVAGGLPAALPETDRPLLPGLTEGPGRAER